MPDFGAHRLAAADVQVGDVLVKKGEAVIASTFSANRDPAAFENPENMNINRTAVHPPKSVKSAGVRKK
ncbi:cytochrome P450 [Rhodococcus sp. 27YEA15]|uniref:cytochrome P450 n=1 Tax=Rhodococcus sp. 27YEA15 TaxID=3156259 RepID=UPI003C7D9AAA